MEDAFPARAGINRLVIGEPVLPVSVPRTRGDEPNYVSLRVFSNPRSPHARG